MKIDRNNYEIWLLDYLEGRLGDQEQREVTRFLEENPDCTLEIVELEPWILVPDQIVYPSRSGLKKHLPDSRTAAGDSDFDLFSVARMEGDLTNNQVQQHERLIRSDTEKEKAWEQIKRTRLSAGQVVFPRKYSLKRKQGLQGRILRIGLMAAAAALALLLLVFNDDQAPPSAGRMAFESGEHPAISQGEKSTEPVETGTGEAVREDSPEGSPAVPLKPMVQGEPENKAQNARNATQNTGQERNRPGNGSNAAGSDRESDPKIGTPAMFSIQKNQDKPIPERVRPTPIRIASLGPPSHMKGTGEGGIQAPSYDRIEHLEIPPATIHLSSLSVAQLAGIDLQELVDVYAKEKDLSLWTVANAGLKGINRITGSDISLMASRDTDGEVSGFRFKSKLLNISAPIGQEE